MRPRQPAAALPRLWLMTDERLGDRLWTAIARLPRGAGIVFRHYRTPAAERRALFARLAAIARRRGLVLVAGGAVPPGWRGLVHGGGKAGRPHTAPAHSRREAIAAIRAGAVLLFASPVHPTRSHPGARALGPARLGLMIRDLPVPVVALGGMDARRARALAPLGIHGWAAIDAWAAADAAGVSRR
ncbi:thiamine phosphate synthase [Sphingomonas flavalba]|uniref:thiamine phosphate synthase n=1 Tax=Sphingomonas flavalba TaxID=2559804 RepID=UPI001447D8DA|nr:thiamine phosphate synthase [Sphingomonas flavalba]